MRIDLLLVEKKLVASRTQAQDLITSGHVFIKKNNQDVVILKSNQQISEADQDSVFIQKNEIQKYVSRGGLKLERALAQAKIVVAGQVALDIGQSTGGFTDCLLHHDIKKVVGIDVGHDQLHEKVKANLKVISFEGLHIKDLADHAAFQKSVPKGGFDLLVADVSFISLTKVMPFVKQYLKLNGDFLLLVKPQFELTANDLDRNGVVKNPKKYSLVQSVIEQEARQQFGNVIDYFESETPGKDGNQEFFIYGQKTV
ncbi:MAG: TlyA family RNA methyltransferase [Bdellovibrio sp.]|nr:TlyA family RNA methyltransferase [Bdellovibrio sp.]